MSAATSKRERGADPVGRGLEVLLGLLVGSMGGRILWRGLVEGFDIERILGGGVMFGAALALCVHSLRRGRSSGGGDSGGNPSTGAK